MSPHALHHDVQQVLQAFLGNACWQVRRGEGSFLTFEFGEVRTVTRKPIELPDHLPKKLAARLRRPGSYKHGEWHLWIYSCHWCITSRGKQLASSEATNESLGPILRRLSGRAIVDISIDPHTAATRFSFGKREASRLDLATRPRPGELTAKQWLLYTPERRVLVIRGTGEFDILPMDEVQEEDWQSLCP